MPAHVITSEQQRDRMLLTPIPRLILSLCLPTLATQLISVFYNTADTYFVSKLSTSASAAAIASRAAGISHCSPAGPIPTTVNMSAPGQSPPADGCCPVPGYQKKTEPRRRWAVAE